MPSGFQRLSFIEPPSTVDRRHVIAGLSLRVFPTCNPSHVRYNLSTSKVRLVDPTIAEARHHHTMPNALFLPPTGIHCGIALVIVALCKLELYPLWCPPPLIFGLSRRFGGPCGVPAFTQTQSWTFREMNNSTSQLIDSMIYECFQDEQGLGGQFAESTRSLSRCSTPVSERRRFNMRFSGTAQSRRTLFLLISLVTSAARFTLGSRLRKKKPRFFF